MKATFLIFLLLAFFGGFSQVKKDSSPDVICYLDSVKVNSISEVNLNDISGIIFIRVKDSINKIIKGRLYVSSKKHPVSFITIGQLTKRAIPDSDRNAHPVIYFVEDKLVTDTTGMKFANSFLIDVDVIYGSQVKAFKKSLRQVITVKIKRGDSTIYIR